jgi:hypothetical protein
MAWPKIVSIRGGVQVPIDDFEELDALVERYGGDALIVTAASSSETKTKGRGKSADLSASNRALLEQFVAAGSKGLPTSQIGPAVGKKGKGIKPALERYARSIGLVEQDGANAFVAVKGKEGRGFKLGVVHFQAARTMLGLS